MTLTQRLYTIGCFLFIWYACLAIIPQISLLLGFKIALWQFGLSAAVFVMAAWFFFSKNLVQTEWKSFGLNLFITLLIFSASILISSQFIDLSFDGNWYHLDAVYLLKNGWNPVYEVLSTEQTSYSDKYLNHFPKTSWVVSASIYNLTGIVESGKSVNLLLLIAGLFVGQNLLQSKFQLSGFLAWAFALVIAASPIVLLNLFGNCVDGQVASLILLGVLFCAYQICEGAWVNGLFALIAFALLANFKFNTGAYAVLFVTGFLLYLWYINSYRFSKILYTGLAWGIFTFGVLGWNPYMSNLIRNGHPLYPLSEGVGHVFDKKAIYPANFLELNWAERFIQSFFAEPSWKRNPESSQVKKLFSKNNLDSFDTGVPDLAAFGPYAPEVFLFLLPFTLLAFYFATRKHKITFLWVISFLLLSIIINPEAWLLRYVPQFWVLIVVFILMLTIHSKVKFLPWLFILVLAYSNYLIFEEYLNSNLVRTKTFKEEVALIKEHPQDYEYYHGWTKSSLYRLQDLGLNERDEVYIAETDTLAKPFSVGLGAYFKKRNIK